MQTFSLNPCWPHTHTHTHTHTFLVFVFVSCSRPAAHLVQEEQEQECLQGSHLRKTSRLIQNERRLNPLWEIWRGADAHAAEALLWSPAREKEREGERRRIRKEEEVRGGKQSLSKPSATFFLYFFLGKGPRTSHVFKSYLENRTIKLFFFLLSPFFRCNTSL